jgi:phosphate-selective porin OprO/OprP
MITLLSVAGLFAPAFSDGEVRVDGRTIEAKAPEADAALMLPADNELTWSWNNGLRFETADGAFKFKFGGRIQWDNTWFSANDDFTASGLVTDDGTEFRRSRIYISGDIYDDSFFKAQYDFAGLDADFKDVFMGRKDVIGTADAKLGHFKEPFSIGQLTSSRFTTFLERALPDIFAPERNSGISVYDTALDDNLTWAAGIFRNTDDGGSAQADGGYAVTARVTGTPIYEDDGDRVLHLGAAYSMRDAEGLRFSQRPEAHLTNRWVDTGTLAADDVSLANVELAGVMGPCHATAEFMQASVNGTSGAADPDYSGYYVEAGYFITGETRTYNRSSAAFDRVKPKRRWDKNGGKGAWEIAARYSSLDLTDSGISGGEIDDITLGVNWYLNNNMRMMFNYVNSSVENGSFDESADIFLLRFQVDW